MSYKNTYLFSPVVLDGGCPYRHKTYLWKQWWFEQRQRCLNGYTVDGVRITGDHYWYLNFWKILGKQSKDSKRKTLIHPRFTQLDKEFFDAKERAHSKQRGMVVAKVRQCGFSEKASALAGKEFCLFPNSETLIIGGEKKYAEDTMRKVHRGLRSLVDTEFHKRVVGDLDYLEAKFKPKGRKDYVGYMSKLITITCQDNVQATVGKTPSLAIFEEAGKFKNLIASFDYLKPAMMNEGKVICFFLIFGTGGEMGQGADQLQTIFYNPKAYLCDEYEDIYSQDFDPSDATRKKVGFFVPAFKYNILDDDNNYLIEESLVDFNQRRETAKTSTDSGTYFKEITQFPIYSEECFLITEGKFFNVAKLNSRLSEIKKHNNITIGQLRGDLHWKFDEKGERVGVSFEEKINGRFLIIEPPVVPEGNPTAEFNKTYKGGTDSYDRDVTSDNKGSLGSCSIINARIKKFVARLTERPDTADEFFDDTAKLCYFYGAYNLIEYSNILIFKWYKDNNLEWMLKERPELAYANVKNSGMTNRYGVDPATKNTWLVRLKDYIEKYYSMLDDEEQITALLKYRIDPKYNCDITISSALCIVHMEDDVDSIYKEDVEKSKNSFLLRGYKFNTKSNRIETFKRVA